MYLQYLTINIQGLMIWPLVRVTVPSSQWKETVSDYESIFN